MHLLLKIKPFLSKHQVLFWGLLLLSFLMFKNPFSGQNIISDFGPLPDVIYYLYPAQSLVEGKGLKIIYQDSVITPITPPLYTLIVAPIYVFFNDLRAFYFINIGLILISTIFFYQIILKISSKVLVKIIVFLTFISTPIIYWYPSTAMPENLLICLFIISIWLLLKPVSTVTTIATGVIAVAFFASKYVAWPLSVSLGLIFFLKIVNFKRLNILKLKLLVILLLSASASFLIYSQIEFSTKGVDVLKVVWENLKTVLSAATAGKVARGEELTSQKLMTNYISTLSNSSMYSLGDYQDKFFRYLAGLMGGQIPVAGKNFQLIPIVVGMASLAGLFFNLCCPKQRLLTIYLFLSVLGMVLFAPMFIDVDARYMFVPMIVLILSYGLLLQNFQSILTHYNRSSYFYFLTLSSLILITFSLYVPLKNQLRANFISSEGSAYYQVAQMLNNYFKEAKTDQRSYVITILPPHILAPYSNHRYSFWPLTKAQRFAQHPDVWKIPESGNYLLSYQQYYSKGSNIYLLDYGIADNTLFYQSYLRLKGSFHLNKVAEGCYKRCSLFKLSN